MMPTSARRNGIEQKSASLEITGSLSPVRFALAVVLVPAVVAWVHLPVLHARALVFDDNEYVADNALVQNPSWSSARRFMGEVLEPSTVGGYYQPLSMISLMIDYALGGRAEDPRVFHVTSLALHAANAALVFLIFLRLFDKPIPAAIGGLLFGLHPTCVESVAWIAERKTLLAGFLALSSVLAYLRYAQGVRNDQSLGKGLGIRGGGLGAYLTSLLLFGLALLSKPSATPIPLLLLLLDLWPLGRIGRRALIEKLPFVLFAAASAVVTVISQDRTAVLTQPLDYPPSAIPLLVCHNLLAYLVKFVWPVSLAAYDPFPKPFDFAQPMILAGVIVTVALLIALVLSLRWTRAWLVGWLFFFVAILPSLGVVGFTMVITADRFLYLPMLGLLLPITFFFSRLTAMPRAKWLIGLVVVICVTGESFLTRRYLTQWKDGETVFRHMLQHAPDAGVVYRGLGITLKKQGRIDEAIDVFQRSIDVANDPVAHSNLAVLLAPRGQTAEAVYHCRQAVLGRPKWAVGHNNLGNALAQQGRLDESADAYRRAIELRPDYAEAYNNLGIVFAQQGRLDDAIQQYAKALSLRPNMANAYHNWGDAALEKKNPEEAVAHFQEAVRLNPRTAASWIGLGDAFLASRRPRQAADAYAKTLQIDSTNPEAKQKYDEAAHAP